jgi:hypothetical protein
MPAASNLTAAFRECETLVGGLPLTRASRQPMRAPPPPTHPRTDRAPLESGDPLRPLVLEVVVDEPSLPRIGVRGVHDRVRDVKRPKPERFQRRGGRVRWRRGR